MLVKLASLSQSTSATITNPTKITFGVSANSSTATVSPRGGLILDGNPSQISSNVVSSSVAEVAFAFYASLASSVFQNFCWKAC